MRNTFKSFAVSVGLVLGVAHSAYATEKLTYASYYAEAYTVSQADIWMMQEIEKRTHGEIKFERYHNATLLKAPDIYPGLSNGAVDVGSGTPAGYNRNQYRLSNVVMPYISSNAPAVGAALLDLYQTNPAFKKEYDDRGVKVLYFLPWGEGSFYSSKAPLAKTDDFKGKKIRSTQAVAQAVEALGGTAVAMTWNEAVEGLSRGVVDVVGSVPFDSGVIGGMHESAKFGSDGGDMGIFAFAAISINKKRFDKLTPQQQKIIEEVGAEVPAKYYEFLNASYDQVVDRLCNYKGDFTINVFSPEEAAKASQKANAALRDNWVKWAAKGNEVETRAILDQYITLVSKYEKKFAWNSGYQRLKARNCAQ